MAASSDLPTRTLAELRALNRARRTVQFTVAGIFAVIILVWIVGGYWRKNIPVFISTLAVAMGTQAALIASSAPLAREIARREAAGET